MTEKEARTALAARLEELDQLAVLEAEGRLRNDPSEAQCVRCAGAS
ncbi:hypothetical protein [Aurantiacibacter marinus]|nr:hypothetical protein [Aurantiacibacter marinus]